MRVFITGSSDGIGHAGAKLLADQGHKVYLHARNEQRAKQAQDAVPNAAGVVIGDLGSIDGTKKMADEANKYGPFDSIVHNAGLGPSNGDNKTPDGIASTFAVNSLGPYILTALMAKPKRLLYLSSGLHNGSSDSFDDITWTQRKWDAMQAYNDSKLHDIMLANAIARYWPDVQSCSMDPGWIKTKMGGGGAPGVVGTPAKAMADFAAGEGKSPAGQKTAVYFTPQGAQSPKKIAEEQGKQEELMGILRKLSGVSFPK